MLIGRTRFLQGKMQRRGDFPGAGWREESGLCEEEMGIPEMAKRDEAERILDEAVGMRVGNAHSSRETKAR